MSENIKPATAAPDVAATTGALNSVKDAAGKKIVPTRQMSVDDASDNDPQDPVEKIIIQRGFPPAGSDVEALEALFKYFKSRETKKTVKAVALALISAMPWLVYLILDKVFG
jgi:hypothetical protein